MTIMQSLRCKTAFVKTMLSRKFDENQTHTCGKGVKLFKFVFLLNGGTVLQSSTKQLSLAWFLMILNLLTNFYRLQINATNVMKSANSPLRACLFFIQSLFSIIIHFKLRQKCAKLDETIRFCIEKMDKVHKAEFSRSCIYYSLFMLFFVLLEIGRRFMLWFNEGTAKYIKRLRIYIKHANIGYHIIVFTDIFCMSLHTYAWVSWSMIYYLFVFAAIRGMNRSLHAACTQELLKLKGGGGGALVVRRLRETRHAAMFAKRNATHSMTLIPFMYFSLLFMEATLRLIHFTKYRNFSIYFLVAKWSAFVLNNVFIIIAATIVDKTIGEEFEFNFQISQTMSSIHLNAETQIEKLSFLMEIVQLPSSKASCLGMFRLSRSQVLTYLGAAIPFAVMLLSLEQATVTNISMAANATKH